MPIGYYSQYYLGASVVASSIQATTADDYLAQAKALLSKKGGERDVIKLAGEALATRQSAEAYFYRAYAKDDLGNKQGAIADLSQAIAINPRDANVYYNRGNAKFDLGDKQGACLDYKKAASLGAPATAQWLNSDGGAWCRNMP